MTKGNSPQQRLTVAQMERSQTKGIPYHSGKILHPKVLTSILRDSDLTVEKFKELLK